MKKLVLASASPRRRKMLQDLGVRFSVLPASVEEPPHAKGENPSTYVKKIAELKARAFSRTLCDAFVIGADTVVVYRGKVLGKPRTMPEAFDYMQMLNGRTHAVYTGLCIADTQDGSVLRAYEKTKVDFRRLTENEIRHYLSRIDPLDKAGGYAIQGAGALLVAGISGCYYNVVGFPIARLELMLLRKGTSLFAFMKQDARGRDRK